MEDLDSLNIDNKTSSSQISYILLDGERTQPYVRRWCKTTTPILISVLLLTVIIPLYVVTRSSYVQTPLTNAHDVPQQWVERAIYYNTWDVDPQWDFVKELRSKYKLVCYYTFPSENATNSLQPTDIDSQLCTHIIIGFAVVVNHTISVDTYQSQVIHNLVALKVQNPDLKILLSVGGAGGTGGFPEMVLNHASRKTFIGSIDSIVRSHSIDGIDLDWEFPNKEPSSDSHQKMHFTQLLHEIRNEINRQHRFKFLLTVAVAAPRFIIDLAYDISYMNSYVDFVNVMSYDYHFYTQLTPFTGLNSPLYADVNQTGYVSTLNINYTVNYWAENGMDLDKIVVGLPTYAHSFELYNMANNGLMAPARGYGSLGHSGFVNYPDVCAFLAMDRVNYNFVYSARSPYAVREWDWISFDDETSLTFKTEYVKYRKLGGAMILSLNADDYRGSCSKKKNDGNLVKFPLTARVKSVLQED